MVETLTDDRVAVRVLAQVGRELAELTSVGASLQGLLGAVASGGPVDRGFLMDAQGLDGLVQHMGELALFLERLAAEATEIGLSEEALARAAGPVRLSELSDRLLSKARTVPVLPSGEYELW